MNPKSRILAILIIITINSVSELSCQIALSELTKIGVIPGNTYNLKVAGASSYQYLVVKLVPNLQQLNNCTTSVVDNYKQMLNRILSPIDSAITKVRNAIKDKPSGGIQRFWGAVIGGAALVVATSAQITAGVALHNSLENAKAIMQMKDSIRESNKAIQELHNSQAQTIIAINALQEQINNQLVPAINTLGCSVIANSLGLRLNQYFSEISLVFGPNLRDPTSQTLSIQAISKAFNGDFDTLLSKLQYTSDDLLDILESDSIRGRIIGVSLDEYMIILQIEYPALTTITDAVVQKFNLISYNHKGSEWLSVFPTELLVRGTYISNIDISSCTQTTNSIICESDTSSPISSATYNCATGDLSSCARTKVVTSHVPRFALSGGVLFMNCMPIVCRCESTGRSIIQDLKTTNIMISQDECEEVYIENMFITLGPKKLNREIYADNVTLGGQVSVENVDIGNELNSIQESLNKTQDHIDKANELLDKVNPNIVNADSFSVILAISILLFIWFIISLIWMIALTKRVFFNYNTFTNSNRSSTVNSLSSFVN
uniref:Fusion glycoprotein F0 n=1 Tax=Gainesville rodent jeilong virus 1 TaxID=3163281 RepID=A0AAU7T2E0_9MONO